MFKEFIDFIVARCEEAKLNDEEYMACERSDCDPLELQDRAQILCYIQGLKDAKALYEILGFKIV